MEGERLNSYSLVLRPPSDTLCHTFISKIRASRDKCVLGEMHQLNVDSLHIQNSKEKPITSLEEYIASLNVNQQDVDMKDSQCDRTLDFALGTHWKLEVNSFNLGFSIYYN